MRTRTNHTRGSRHSVSRGARKRKCADARCGSAAPSPTEYRDTVCTREGLRDRAVSRAVIQEVVGGLEKEEGGGDGGGGGGRGGVKRTWEGKRGERDNRGGGVAYIQASNDQGP